MPQHLKRGLRVYPEKSNIICAITSRLEVLESSSRLLELFGILSIKDHFFVYGSLFHGFRALPRNYTLLCDPFTAGFNLSQNIRRFVPVFGAQSGDHIASLFKFFRSHFPSDLLDESRT